jgi:hypothetical protein
MVTLGRLFLFGLPLLKLLGGRERHSVNSLERIVLLITFPVRARILANGKSLHLASIREMRAFA